MAVNSDEKPKLRWYEHGWLAMPLVLILIGGLLGGLAGGLAWGVNRIVFDKVEHPVMRYVWTGLITFASFFVWVLLVLIFRQLFARQ